MQLDFDFTTSNGLDSRAGIEKIRREDIEYSVGLVQATTWEPRYNFHKYWGKKPGNLVGRYIDYFSNPGDIVLDPFCGSGVTVVEGAIRNRTSFGTDLNPIAVRMTNALLRAPSTDQFNAGIQFILEKLSGLKAELFSTVCRKCSAVASLRSSAYKANQIYEVRYKCDSCGYSGVDKPNASDSALSTQSFAPTNGPDADIFYGWQMRKLKKANVARWNELFTARNFFAATNIWREIKQYPDTQVREWMLLSFTAALAQFTKMIADFKGQAGGPSWKINCYWLPTEWQELNPFWYFENRLKKSLAAIEDIQHFAINQNSRATLQDSRHLPFKDNEVGYIFTDPPYGGEGIQYGELSMLWNLWLEEDYELSREVAFNPVRNLNDGHYSEGLKAVFAECYRVLQPGRWLTVTFANKDPEIWEALMSACDTSGFELKAVVPAKRSAPSLTETNMKAAPKSDLVLSFQKPGGKPSRNSRKTQISSASSLEQIIVKHALVLAGKHARVSIQDLFDVVLIELFSSIYIDEVIYQPLSLTSELVERTLERDIRFGLLTDKKVPYFFLADSKNSVRSV